MTPGPGGDRTTPEPVEPTRPPARAERFLTIALGDSLEARTVLGDLAEDHARAVRLRGSRAAHFGYWREALSLGLPAALQRLLGRPLFTTFPHPQSVTMHHPLSTSGLIQDARYAFRAVRSDRAFFVFATVIIGLGVGASTAAFSVMSPLLLQPLPFRDADELVWITNTDPDGGRSGVTSRTSNLRDFREMATSFDGLAGYNAFFDQGSYTLVGVGEPERLVGVGVTDDFLDVLGVDVALGRNFDPEEGLWGGRPAVILTHGLWQRRFGGDASILGTAVTIDDVPREVVGILPRTFDFASVFTPATSVDFLLTWAISDETDRRGNTTAIVGRLRPGATASAAQAELDNIVASLEANDPDRWGLGATVSGLQESIARPFRTAMMLLAGAAAIVMLIVCVNLSNMLLARSPRRRREMAIRRTMGATRGRLMVQLLMESVIVSMSGALVGAAIAIGVTAFVTGTAGLDIPMLSAVRVDASALVFTAGIAIVAGLLVGLVPALQVAEGGESEALAGMGRGSTSGRAGRRLRELLVVTEVAMACVLLVFGGLVMRSFQRVMDVDLGFESSEAIAWQLTASDDFESATAEYAFFDEIVAGVLAVPGVEAVGLTDALPLGRNRTWGTRIVGAEYADDEGDSYFPHIVDHRYLAALGVPLIEGRGLTAEDDAESAMVVVVNETAASQMFPGGNALGQFIRMWDGQTAEVVGVVGDVKHRALELGADFEIYFSLTQVPDFQSLDMLVRTRLPAEAVVPAVRAAIRAVDANMPVEDFFTMDSVVDRSVSPRRFTLQLLVAFAASALLLAGLGIYGVLSHSVSERIPEIGIRMALGESASEVRWGVVGRTLVLSVVGIIVGSVVSLSGTRLIGSLLYDVAPTDPLTFLAMAVVLMLVAGASGLIPAIRASRIDSAIALRSAG